MFCGNTHGPVELELLAAVWMLGTALGSSAKAAGALNFRTLLPVMPIPFVPGGN